LDRVVAFEPDEWREYRAIRLEALLADPAVFSSSHAVEAPRPDEAWRQRLVDADGGVFAVRVDREVVGMTGIGRERADPEVGFLWGSWLRPAARGRGLSAAMYEARLRWARERGLRRVVVSHRAGNEASRRANQRHGFVLTHAADREWHDGVVEPELCYALDLR
jgi:RimJ/RimL family protein N-acetyltransferase